MIIHAVYFSLKNKNEATVAPFVKDMKSFATNISGVESLKVGSRITELNRPVHDTDFDIVLFCELTDLDALKAYLIHPDHLAFCARHESNWTKIRVFDAEEG